MNKATINAAAREITDICRNAIIPCTTSAHAMTFQLEEHFSRVQKLLTQIGKELFPEVEQGSKAEGVEVGQSSKAEGVKRVRKAKKAATKQEKPTDTAG